MTTQQILIRNAKQDIVTDKESVARFSEYLKNGKDDVEAADLVLEQWLSECGYSLDAILLPNQKGPIAGPMIKRRTTFVRSLAKKLNEAVA